MYVNPYLTDHERQLLDSARIGIAGCGGLGSNIAQLLVRAGIQHLTLVDFDLVELGNLNRQFFFHDQIGLPKVEALAQNLRRINPDISLTLCQIRVSSGNAAELFADCNIVAEAFDQIAAKESLIHALIPKEKIVVGGSGMSGWGNSDSISVTPIGSRLYLAGDRKSEVSPDSPPQAPRVTIVAAKQANTILALLLNKPI